MAAWVKRWGGRGSLMAILTLLGPPVSFPCTRHYVPTSFFLSPVSAESLNQSRPLLSPLEEDSSWVNVSKVPVQDFRLQVELVVAAQGGGSLPNITFPKLGRLELRDNNGKRSFNLSYQLAHFTLLIPDRNTSRTTNTSTTASGKNTCGPTLTARLASVTPAPSASRCLPPTSSPQPVTMNPYLIWSLTISNGLMVLALGTMVVVAYTKKNGQVDGGRPAPLSSLSSTDGPTTTPDHRPNSPSTLNERSTPIARFTNNSRSTNDLRQPCIYENLRPHTSERHLSLRPEERIYEVLD